MMRATIETSLGKSCNVADNDVTHILLGSVFNRVFSKIKGYFRMAGLPDAAKTVAKQRRLNKADNGLFVAFMRYQQRKARLLRQALKDDFFFQRQTRRRNIPQRTWNRHSAFLYYSQQMHKQKVHHTAESEQTLNPVAENSFGSVGRMSFQVKSIKPLPVWATAFHELSWIETDLSSLRLMEFRRIETPAAEAA